MHALLPDKIQLVAKGHKVLELLGEKEDSDERTLTYKVNPSSLAHDTRPTQTVRGILIQLEVDV